MYQESWAGSYADHEDGTGKWVRYDTSGKMVKGWDVTERGAYYFDQTTGAMAKGETEIDGIPCIFDRETGIGWNLQWQEREGHDTGMKEENVRDSKAEGRKSMIRQVMMVLAGQRCAGENGGKQGCLSALYNSGTG
ncbi:MAG: hypothetical protein ACLR78_16055 [Roseburia sp.]